MNATRYIPASLGEKFHISSQKKAKKKDKEAKKNIASSSHPIGFGGQKHRQTFPVLPFRNFHPFTCP